MRADPRSLRYRVLVVVVAVVVLPLVWVWVSGTFENGSVVVLRRALHQAVSSAVAAGDDSAALDAIAGKHEVRLRRVSRAGAVLTDVDHTERNRWLTPVTDPFYGPEGVPELSDVDRTLPPLAERLEVVDSAEGPAARCEVVERGLLLICSAAQRTADGGFVHVMRSSPRLVRSLYAERFQLTALTLIVLVIGVVLALFLGWRMVGPIESLRDQVVQRTAGRVSTDPVVLDRADELGELATAFNQLLAALDQRNRSNATFAADLAHELKNPVAAVRAAAEALASERPVEGERRERLQRVLGDASARMEVVVHGFLELARAEAGLPGAEREPVALLALLNGLLGAVRADPRVTVTMTVEGDEVPVLVVPERLETALRNVLVNAASFARTEVRVTVRREGERACVEVRDDGPGIPAADLPRVFDRYFTSREGGTGIGLALTKAVVEAHGGTIEAVPDREGACFRISLPGVVAR